MKNRRYLPFVVLVMSVLSACSIRQDLRDLKEDVALIWDDVSILSAENDKQDLRLSSLEESVINLALPEDVLFETNKSQLTPYAIQKLEKVAKVLRSYPGLNIEIGGHTDNRGSERSNEDLARKRAQAVAMVLYENGISQDKLSIVSYGESEPVADNRTNDGRKLNRRVTLALSQSREALASQRTKESTPYIAIAPEAAPEAQTPRARIAE